MVTLVAILLIEADTNRYPPKDQSANPQLSEDMQAISVSPEKVMPFRPRTEPGVFGTTNRENTFGSTSM
jgi:hypothetical protein